MLMRFASALCLMAATPAFATGPAADGRWQGVIEIPDLPLHATVDLEQSASGEWIGSIIIPELNLRQVELTGVAVHKETLKFAIKGALAAAPDQPATFEARLDNAQSMSGTFTQAGNHAPFVFRRSGSAQVALPPRSTSVAKEMEGRWIGDYELMGVPRHVTLTMRNHGTDPATVDFVVVGKKTNNLPVDLVERDGDFIRIESSAFGISFEGRLQSKKDELAGTFEQGPIELPLVLHRAGEQP